jgi:hypothetical protein
MQTDWTLDATMPVYAKNILTHLQKELEERASLDEEMTQTTKN